MLSNTFDIVRRSHLLISVVALAVFLIALPTGNNLNSGIKQLRDLSSFLTSEDYNRMCAQSGAEVYHNFWVEARSDQPADIAIPISDEVRFGGFVICNKPGTSATLNEYAEFLSAPIQVGIGGFEPRAVYDGLSEVYFADVQLQWIKVVNPHYSESLHEFTIPIASDSVSIDLHVASLDKAPNSPLVLTYNFLLQEEGNISINRDIDPSRMIISPRLSPLDWYAVNGPGGDLLAKEKRDELFILHHIRPFWQEISTMTLPEAIRYLQARADQQQGNIAVLGLEINVNLLGWGGPLLILALLSNLYVYLLHARRLMLNDSATVSDYPWVGLFPDPASTLLRIFSLCIIPVFACIAVSIRSAPTSVAASIWGGLVAIVVGILGVFIIHTARMIRWPVMSKPPATLDTRT